MALSDSIHQTNLWRIPSDFKYEQARHKFLLFSFRSFYSTPVSFHHSNIPKNHSPHDFTHAEYPLFIFKHTFTNPSHYSTQFSIILDSFWNNYFFLNHDDNRRVCAALKICQCLHHFFSCFRLIFDFDFGLLLSNYSN